MKFENINYNNELNVCMVRTPMCSELSYMDFISKKYNEGNIDEFLIQLCKQEIFREAILVASENLYNKIDDYVNGKINSNKKLEQIRISLLKYFIRMTTRTTPFGLFSCVGKSNLYLDSILVNEKKKKARVDIEWLFNIVKEVEKEHYSELSYFTNDAVYEKGERIIIPYITGGENWNLNMRNSKPVREIIAFCREEKSYSEIKNILKKNYVGITDEKIRVFIKELIDKEVIISNIRPSLNTKDQLEDMIMIMNNISGLEELAASLQEVYDKIDEYNRKSIGAGEEVLLELIGKMKKIGKSKVYLQVDAFLDDKLQEDTNIAVNNKSYEESIKKIVKLIMKISSIEPLRDTIFDEYKIDFMEKYGEDREVLLTEMLDDDIGIGTPFSYNNPYAYRRRVGGRNFTKENKLTSYMWDKYEKAIKNNEPIHIDDEIFKIESDKEKLEKKDFPDSMEINLICKKDNNNILYYLGPNFGSTGAGKTFGRFTHIDLEYDKVCDEINKLENERLDENVVICELSYIPKKVRAANVARNCNNREYELALFTSSSKEQNNRISLNDIYVGIEHNKFYLKSKRLGKKIKIKTNNMLNTNGDANIIRFLKEIEMDSVIEWVNFPWTRMFEGNNHIPEIRYGNCILSTESWKISKDEFSNIKEFSEFSKKFDEYVKDNNIANLVYITEADNRLLIDVRDIWGKKILYKQVAKNDVKLCAYEKGSNIANDKKGNTYNCEIVVPFIKTIKGREERTNEKKIKNNTQKILDINNKTRYKMLGSDWLYLKLYGAGEWHDNFIMYYISQYMDELLRDKKIDKYFYMRYVDPERHIRLRLNGSTVFDYLLEITDWLGKLCDIGVISRYEIGCYEREIERYGGVYGIDIAENIFYYDSRIIEKILLYMKEEKITFEKELVGTILVISYMEQFGWNYEKQLEWLEQCFGRAEYKQDFNKNRREYARLCNSDNEWEGLRKDQEGRILYELFKQRENSVGMYRKAIGEDKVTTDEGIILGSIIHLSCNRLFGTDRELEKKIMLYARHTLHELKYLKNNGTK